MDTFAGKVTLSKWLSPPGQQIRYFQNERQQNSENKTSQESFAFRCSPFTESFWYMSCMTTAQTYDI